MVFNPICGGFAFVWITLDFCAIHWRCPVYLHTVLVSLYLSLFCGGLSAKNFDRNSSLIASSVFSPSPNS